MATRHVAAFSIVLLALAFTAFPAYAAGSSTELVAAVKNVSTQADKFRSKMSNLTASQFHMVNAREVLVSSDEPVYQTSLKKNAADISDLRDTLTHTTVTGDDGVVVPLRKVLLAKNIAVEQIIAVYCRSDGSITLYYR